MHTACGALRDEYRTRLFVSLSRPNRNREPQFHSHISLLATDDRLIFRETSRLYIAGHHNDIDTHNLQVCPHYADRFIPQHATARLGYWSYERSSLRWAVEKAWKCELCGTEGSLLLVEYELRQANVLFSRYVDLGGMGSAECKQWNQVTTRRMSIVRVRNDPCPVFPPKMNAAYGPLIKIPLLRVLRYSRHLCKTLSKITAP
ncbi:hypothetical protein BT63DRAFT_230839 [Microthyrium microscopicum]|uniref:Uncharacterized protein n=1 Tax=Microthyrium microscopicum TaxID=703497 RepID=A0A6A6UF82_9PEZI|nr:hypothetical protein BT63DRAFT_230839 [Microthyrium microscopicum]